MGRRNESKIDQIINTFDNYFTEEIDSTQSRRKQKLKEKWTNSDPSSDAWTAENNSSIVLANNSWEHISQKAGQSFKAPKRRPVPQKRSPGTKLKITQWIVERLRDPTSNPEVLTWIDEKQGVFLIKDTSAFSKLWGKVKKKTT